MSPHPSLLLLAIGNPDRGDDAIAWKIAAELDGRLPEGATLLRCSGDLLSMIELWERFDAMICFDATAPQANPGRITRFDLAEGPLPVAFETVSSHAFGLGQTLALAQRVGRTPAKIVIYAVEGSEFATGAPLSPDARAAIAPASEAILAEARGILEDMEHA